MAEETHHNLFGNMVDATNDLSKRGFTDQFKMDDEGLCASGSENKHYQPSDLKIVEYHRFEGPSNPDDMAVVYAIETSDGKKGTLIDAYGTYSSQKLTEFIQGIPVRPNPS